MGCCGKKRTVAPAPIPRGQVAREMPLVSSPPPPPPRTPRASVSLPKSSKRGENGDPFIVEGNKVCGVCGTKLQARMVWSKRLRRRYPVSYCPRCNGE